MSAVARHLGARVTISVVAATCLGYVAQRVSGSWWRDVDHVRRALGYSARELAAGEWWRLWTVNLVHDPVPPEYVAPGFMHLVNNVVPLFLVGPVVERHLGGARYAAFLFAAGGLGSVLAFAIDPPTIYAGGASGLVMATIGAGLYMVVSRRPRRPWPWVAAAAGVAYATYSIVDRAEITAVAHGGALLSGLAMAIPLDPNRPRRVAAGAFASALVIVVVAMPLVSSRLRDVDERVVSAVPVGTRPSRVQVVGDHVVVHFDPSTNQRGVAVDERTNAITPSATEAAPDTTNVDAGRLSWSRRGSTVVGVDASGGVAHRISLGNGWAYDLARGGDEWVWVVDGPGRRLLAIDGRTGDVVDEVDLGLIVPVAIDVDVDDGRAWVADYWGGRLLELDLTRGP
ncbi:MAG TPA: rhomboid family intramembrane serine protease [Acidimicrobiales bacterium]